MNYRELDQAEYDRKLRMVIVGGEGLHAHVQNVGDDRETIGWGYTLNRDNNVEIWREAGIDLTAEQWQTLVAVDAAPRADRTRVGLTFTRQLNEAEADGLYGASVQEKGTQECRMVANSCCRSLVLALLVVGLASCSVTPAARAQSDQSDAPPSVHAAEPGAPQPQATISEPAKPGGAASDTPFTGAWTVQWCEDPVILGRPCGGFHAYLSQVGNRVCGTYAGVDQRANQMDEGEPRSIIGTVVNSTVVLVITSERNHGIYLATAKIEKDALRWDITSTVKDGNTGEPALIADGDQLIRSASDDDSQYLNEVIRDCALEEAER